MVIFLGLIAVLRLTCICLSRSFSASCTQGALSLGVSDFHFLPVKKQIINYSLQIVDQTKSFTSKLFFQYNSLFSCSKKEMDHKHENLLPCGAIIHLHELNNPVWEKNVKKVKFSHPIKKLTYKHTSTLKSHCLLMSLEAIKMVTRKLRVAWVCRLLN